MNVLWSAQSEKDLDAIHAYIASDSEHYADLQVQRIIQRAAHVAARPMRGHPVHELPTTELREVHEGSYRIIYRAAADQLTVVTVVHMKQRLPRKRLGGV